jgi:hypothetical protein
MAKITESTIAQKLEIAKERSQFSDFLQKVITVYPYTLSTNQRRY